jgi:hypothetical protein
MLYNNLTAFRVVRMSVTEYVFPRPAHLSSPEADRQWTVDLHGLFETDLGMLPLTIHHAMLGQLENTHIDL